MTNHNHNSKCGCKEHHHEQDGGWLRNFCLKWVFCVLFIIVSFYFLRPLLVQQLVSRASTYMSYPLYEDAIRQYKKAIFFDRNNSDIHASLAYVYKSKNDIARAKLAYQTAIKLNPKNTAALFDLGMIYLMEKNYKEAAVYFASIVELGPEDRRRVILNLVSYHHSALRMLAVCHEKLNKKVEEKMSLQKLLHFYPDDKNAKEKLREIK